jgi:hypothetical protein
MCADFCEDEDGDLIEDMDIAGIEGAPELLQIQNYVKRQKKKGNDMIYKDMS